MPILEQNCRVEIGIVLPIIKLTVSAIILTLTCEYIKIKSQIESQCTFYLTLMLFCIQTMYLLTHVTRDLFYCRNPDISNYFGTAAWCLFIAQYGFLLFLYFDRLRRTFVGSVDELSRCTTYTFYICFSLWIGIGMPFNMCITMHISQTMQTAVYEATTFETWEHYTASTDVSLAVLNIIFIFFLISMSTALFVYKLITINRSMGRNQGVSMLSTITKISVLGSITISSLLYSFAVLFIGSKFIDISILSPIHFDVLRGSVLTLDTLVNFLSMFLTFAHFDEYYLNLCGCCDTNCKKMFQILDKSNDSFIRNNLPNTKMNVTTRHHEI